MLDTSKHDMDKATITRYQDNFSPPLPIIKEDDFHPKMELKYNDVVLKIVNTNKMYSDQTGAFPFPSRRGYRYLLISYDVDSNAVLARPLK